MTKVAVSGYYGFNNFGDEAILSVIINKLKFLNADITVFSSNPKFTKKTYGVKSVKTFDIPKVVMTLLKSDILISGGGSLLQDVTSIKSLLYYSLVIMTALIFRKKVIIFAQGIGPVNRKFAQVLVKNLLSSCKYVSVRDENSLNLLKSWNVDAELVCDPIYSVPVTKGEFANTVGVQLRDYKTMNYNLLTKLAEQIVIEFSDKKIEIFSFQNSIDLDLCKKFEGILKALNPDIETEVIPAKSLKETIDKLSKLEYLIAMRFHAVLVALMAGVKTCAINYDPKVEKLADEAKIPLISMDAKENFPEVFSDLINLKKTDLIKFAQSKHFDWTNIEKIINS